MTSKVLTRLKWNKVGTYGPRKCPSTSTQWLFVVIYRAAQIFTVSTLRRIVCQQLKPFFVPMSFGYRDVRLRNEKKFGCRSPFGGKNEHRDTSTGPKISIKWEIHSPDYSTIWGNRQYKKTLWRWPSVHCNSTSVQKIWCRIQRNPERSANRVASDLNVSDWSIWPILKKKSWRPLKNKCPELQRKKRLERSKALIRLLDSGQLPNLVFSDESTFLCVGFGSRACQRSYRSGSIHGLGSRSWKWLFSARFSANGMRWSKM